MLDLLMLAPLMIGSALEAREDAQSRVDTWDLKRICPANSEWTAEDQKRLRAELAPLDRTSMIRSRLAPDWLRMRDGNRICRGENISP